VCTTCIGPTILPPFKVHHLPVIFSIPRRRGYVSLNQDFRGMGRLWGIFFSFYKTRHILLSNSANCTVLRAVVLTQYRRVTDRQTDGQTDGIAVASTALAMRALRRAVKTYEHVHARQTNYRTSSLPTNCSSSSARDCAQLWCTIRRGAIMVIFSVIPRTILAEMICCQTERRTEEASAG